MSLDQRGIRSALGELDNVLVEVRVVGWEENTKAERAALAAARRAIAQVDGCLSDRLDELAAEEP